ncbi:MAG: multiheme c-type cytochrome [Candidatus Eisenbacteria bacterium]|nr:multiheme c-type cytochrome [Candidatus Eisenbacteria bacterium]
MQNRKIKKGDCHYFLVFVGMVLFLPSFSNTVQISQDNEVAAPDYWKAPLGPTQSRSLPRSVPSLLSKSCKGCHSAIFSEWSGSRHASAWTDTIFQSALALTGNPPVCLNCHTPLENQQATVSAGPEGGDSTKSVDERLTKYDVELQKEGVNCSACHIRNGKIHGPYTDSRAAHPMEGSALIKSAEFCFPCHSIPAPAGSGLARPLLDTPVEWKSSGYAQEGKTCQSCHMPREERIVGLGGPSRISFAHTWQPGRDLESLKSAISACMNCEGPGPDGTVHVFVSITNSGAGHNFPTSPYAFLEVIFSASDSEGKEIARKTETLARVLKREGLSIKGELSDTTLKPKETRTLVFEFALAAKADVTVRSELRYHYVDGDTFAMLKIPREVASRPWVTLLNLSQKL